MIGMAVEKRIGIIGGGKMGEGLIAGLLKTKTVEKDNLLIGEVVPDKREHLQSRAGKSRNL